MPVERYSNGDITVTYDPEICTHAARCVKGLPAVFNADKKPWVDIDGASAEEIERQVGKCPSRALKFMREGKS